MASSKSSVALNRILSDLKVECKSSELFEKLTKKGKNITFNSNGIPIIQKRANLDNQIESIPSYSVNDCVIDQNSARQKKHLFKESKQLKI